MENVIEDTIDSYRDIIWTVWLLAAPILSIYFMIKGTEYKWLRRAAQITFLGEIYLAGVLILTYVN